MPLNDKFIEISFFRGHAWEQSRRIDFHKRTFNPFRAFKPEMLCTIWYHLYNLKNLKNTHGGVLLLLKVALLHGCFSHFLNCRNSNKLHKASNIIFLSPVKIQKNFWFFHFFREYRNGIMV